MVLRGCCTLIPRLGGGAMHWLLWSLVAVDFFFGAIALWFFLGAVASFIRSEIDLLLLTRRRNKRGSKTLLLSGPLGLLAVCLLLILALLEIVLAAGWGATTLGTKLAALARPFRKLARI